MSHLSEERINDLVDGLVAGDELAEAEGHLRHSAACRDQVAGHRALLGRLAALPAGIDPGVDLRPAIHARVRLPVAGAPGWRQSLRSLRYPLAAAAVALVLVSSTLTLWLVQREPRSQPLRALGPVTVGTPAGYAGFRALESGYAREVAELQRVLEDQRDLLDPETVRLIERNLEVIDRAIAESRAALGGDPNSRALQQMLLSTYRQKVEILQRAAEIETVS